MPGAVPELRRGWEELLLLKLEELLEELLELLLEDPPVSIWMVDCEIARGLNCGPPIGIFCGAIKQIPPVAKLWIVTET